MNDAKLADEVRLVLGNAFKEYRDSWNDPEGRGKEMRQRFPDVASYQAFRVMGVLREREMLSEKEEKDLGTLVFEKIIETVSDIVDGVLGM